MITTMGDNLPVQTPKQRAENIAWAKERLAQTNSYLHEMMKILGMRLILGNAAGMVAVLGFLKDLDGKPEKLVQGYFVFTCFSIGFLGGLFALLLLTAFLNKEREWRSDELRKAIDTAPGVTPIPFAFEKDPPFISYWSNLISAAVIVGLIGMLAGLLLSIGTMLNWFPLFN